MNHDELVRRNGENDVQYHKRILYSKLIDHTMPDVSYQELSDYLYGQHMSEDVCRRLAYGSCRTLQLIDKCTLEEDGSSSSDLIKEIEAKRLELQKERQRFFDQRREYNKLIAGEGRSEHLFDCLKDAMYNLCDNMGLVYDDCDEDIEYGDSQAILVLSDWHYGMVTDNVFNKYDVDTCTSRVVKTVIKARKKLRLHGCNALHVVILGDMFHGAIHTSARVASEELVCDQIIHVSELIAQSIVELSKDVEHVYVYMTYGNHARTIQNKNDSVHEDNMEKLIPWWLKWRLKDIDKISIVPQENNEFILLNVCGHDFCASHGDIDSVASAPRLLPVLFQKKFGKNIECILLGDKHHRTSYEELSVSSMLCGSLCGTDDYANEKRLYSTPQQLMLIVNEDDGIDAEYRIKCK